MKMRNVETIRHTSFSLRPYILYIMEKRFGLITFSTTIHKDFVGVEGMSEIQVKRFSWIDFHRFPLSMDKNHLIANLKILSISIFIYWLLRDATTPRTTATLF